MSISLPGEISVNRRLAVLLVIDSRRSPAIWYYLVDIANQHQFAILRDAVDTTRNVRLR